MKKTFLITLIILSMIVSAILIFDISKTPSNNNEGLRKPDMAVEKMPVHNQ